MPVGKGEIAVCITNYISTIMVMSLSLVVILLEGLYHSELQSFCDEWLSCLGKNSFLF